MFTTFDWTLILASELSFIFFLGVYKPTLHVTFFMYNLLDVEIGNPPSPVMKHRLISFSSVVSNLDRITELP